MKRIRNLGCILLLLLLLMMMTGCTPQDEWETAQKAATLLSGITEDPQLRTDTEKMLDAIIAEDFGAAYSMVAHTGISVSEFQNAYDQILSLLTKVQTYELIPSYIGKNIVNGVETISVRYMMTAGEQRFFLESARTEGQKGLAAFYLQEYTPVVTTGTVGHMQGANALQWVFLIFGMLEIAFVICVFVDCCRHKMRRKWLWLLFIGLGYLVFSLIVTPEQFRLNFNVGVFLSYTRLICYSTGGFTFRFMIPVGAIVYLICRKTLFARYAQYQQQKALQGQTAALAEESVLPAAAQEDIPVSDETK